MTAKPIKSLKQKLRVLVVCHGNLNRSPLCAAYLDYLLGDAADVRTRGMKPDCDGKPASAKVRRFVVEVGAPQAIVTYLTLHRSKACNAADIDWAQYVVYMDGGNLKRILAYNAAHLRLIGLFAYAEGEPTRIADPAFVAASDPALGELLSLITDASSRLSNVLLSQRKTPL